MSGRGGRAARAGVVLLACALLAVTSAPAAAAPSPTAPSPAAPSSPAAPGTSAAVQTPATPRTYVGPAYNATIGAPRTNSESQSKLWFHDQRWWALLSEAGVTSTVRVYQLMPDHTWQPTSALIASSAVETGDAFEDEGGVVHVVIRRGDNGLYHVPLVYDADAHDYSAGAPQLITTKGGLSQATIVGDTTGRLWVAWASPYDVSLAYSDDGQAWTTIWLARTGSGTPETAALVAYGDRVGLMWSDQAQSSFFFAWHRAGDRHPGHWTREVALSGPGMADNHISLVRMPTEGADVLVAAVKTSLGDQGEAADSPLIELLVRASDGTWSETPVSTIGDRLDYPVLQVDATTRTLHLLASRDGSIVDKTAPLDDLRFDPGVGRLLVLGTDGVLAYPTATKSPVNDRSGLVVLASDTTHGTYRHAELPIPATGPAAANPDDLSPPEAPGGLQARGAGPGKAVLSWEVAQDRGGWFPAAEGAPVAGYVVLRDGVELATVSTTTFTDRPRAESDAADEMSVRYEVLAVDASGNRSRAAEVEVTLPAAKTTDVSRLIGLGVLLVAVGIGLRAARRLWVTQRPTPRGPPPRRSPARGASTAGAAR